MQEQNNILQRVEASAIISDTYNCNIRYLVDYRQEMWLKGADVANVLGYSNTREAVRTHVDDEDKITFEEVKKRRISRLSDEEHPHTIYLNKSGLISLVLCSKKAEAKAFKRWITTEVIPAILSTGGYCIQNQTAMVETRNLTHNQYMMRDEFDLHIRLVKFIKECIPISYWFPDAVKTKQQRTCE